MMMSREESFAPMKGTAAMPRYESVAEIVPATDAIQNVPSVSR